MDKDDAASIASATATVPTIKGAFVDSLKRGNDKIKLDRVMAITAEAELKYRRAIEDLSCKLNGLLLKRESQLDMSPADTLSLKPAKDINVSKFIESDMELGWQIRNTGIKLEVAKARYEYLFGAK